MDVILNKIGDLEKKIEEKNAVWEKKVEEESGQWDDVKYGRILAAHQDSVRSLEKQMEVYQKLLNPQQAAASAPAPAAPAPAAPAQPGSSFEMPILSLLQSKEAPAPAPSNAAVLLSKPGENATLLAQLCNHRGEDTLGGWNHSALYSSALRQILQWISERKHDANDLVFADQAAETLSRPYKVGGDLENHWKSLMSDLFGGEISNPGTDEHPQTLYSLGLGISVGSRHWKSDNSICFSVNHGKKMINFVQGINVEIKGHINNADTGVLQNHLYHVYGCSRPDFQVIRKKTCCPALFVDVEGNLLTLSIGVYQGERFLLDHVLATRCEVTPNPDLKKEQATLWYVLRKGISLIQKEVQEQLNQDLNAEYNESTDQISFGSNGWMKNPFHLPSFNQVDSAVGGDPVKFTLKNYLIIPGKTEIQPKRFVFRGELHDGTPCVIKFSTSEYPKEAHLLLANNNPQYAPQLYGCQMFKPWFQVVVMEWIQDAKHFSMIEHERLGDALSNAVSILHHANWVHGDIRDANVLVKNDNVYLIDFEWAGKVLDAETESLNRPRYPRLNPEIWDQKFRKNHGITDGGFIEKEHDLAMLGRLLGN